MHGHSRNGCHREVEQSTQRCHYHITLSISLLDDAHREYTAPYLASICTYMRQLLWKQIADLSSLLTKSWKENHSKQLIGKETMATAFLTHISGLNKIQAAGAYQKEFKSYSSLPICIKVNAVDGIRLPWHKNLLCYLQWHNFAPRLCGSCFPKSCLRQLGFQKP